VGARLVGLAAVNALRHCGRWVVGWQTMHSALIWSHFTMGWHVSL